MEASKGSRLVPGESAPEGILPLPRRDANARFDWGTRQFLRIDVRPDTNLAHGIAKARKSVLRTLYGIGAQ